MFIITFISGLKTFVSHTLDKHQNVENVVNNVMLCECKATVMVIRLTKMERRCHLLCRKYGNKNHAFSRCYLNYAAAARGPAPTSRASLVEETVRTVPEKRALDEDSDTETSPNKFVTVSKKNDDEFVNIDDNVDDDDVDDDNVNDHNDDKDNNGEETDNESDKLVIDDP